MAPRRILAGVGRTLISAGVLLLLFVAYQLWGTGIAQARDQRKGLKTFEAELAATGAAPLTLDPTGAPSTSDSTVPVTVAAPGTVADDPSITTTPGPQPSGPAPISTAAPTIPPVTSSTLPRIRPGRSKQLRPKDGTTIGIIAIPRIKVKQVIVEGSDKESLKTGPGHYPTTPFPGQPGNASIAGHRTTYGHPFFNLDLLKNGDPIFVQTLQGSFRYDVIRTWVVGDKDGSVLADTPGQDVLTLTTCHPKYSAAKRLIVRARLVGPAGASDFFVQPEPDVAPTTTSPPPTTPPTTSAPPTLAAAGVTTPGVATTVVPVDTIAPTGSASSTAVSDTAVSSDSTVASLGAVDPGGRGPIWSIGWFKGHRSTWTSTLLWASGCALIWIAAWFVARRRRFLAQTIVYLSAFVVVFLPALYFCFENLARLLPENL